MRRLCFPKCTQLPNSDAPPSPTTSTEPRVPRNELVAELESLGIETTAALKKFTEKLNLNDVVVKTHRCKHVDLLLSAMVLAMRKRQPTKLKITVHAKGSGEDNLDKRIAQWARSYTRLTAVQLTEKMGDVRAQEFSCVKLFFRVLVAPSAKTLKKARLMIEDPGALLGVLEKLHVCVLESFYTSIPDDIEMFRTAFANMNFTALVEIGLSQSRKSIHLADGLALIAGRCSKVERLFLDFDCPDREDEVASSLQEFPYLEQLMLSRRLSLTSEQWLELYHSNLFLVEVIMKDRSGLSSDTLKLIHLFQLRKLNYNRLARFLERVEESYLKDLRIEHVLNLVEYVKVLVI